MDMTGEYRIPAPRQRVWEALNDPEILKAAIPGCEELNKLARQRAGGAGQGQGRPGQRHVHRQGHARRSQSARELPHRRRGQGWCRRLRQGRRRGQSRRGRRGHDPALQRQGRCRRQAGPDRLAADPGHGQEDGRRFLRQVLDHRRRALRSRAARGASSDLATPRRRPRPPRRRCPPARPCRHRRRPWRRRAGRRGKRRDGGAAAVRLHRPRHGDAADRGAGGSAHAATGTAASSRSLSSPSARPPRRRRRHRCRRPSPASPGTSG